MDEEVPDADSGHGAPVLGGSQADDDGSLWRNCTSSHVSGAAVEDSWSSALAVEKTDGECLVDIAEEELVLMRQREPSTPSQPRAKHGYTEQYKLLTRDFHYPGHV